MIIKELERCDYDIAKEIAWGEFLKYNADDYDADGIAEFEKSINDPEYMTFITPFGAYKNDELVGLIATRSEGSHIALFFVKSEYQGKGIGKKLFEYVCGLNKKDVITVNSSPYAMDIYQHLGFVPAGTEISINGLRFTPMQYVLD